MRSAISHYLGRNLAEWRLSAIYLAAAFILLPPGFLPAGQAPWKGLMGGNSITVKMTDTVDSTKSRQGQTFRGTVSKQGTVNGGTVPVGSAAVVTLTEGSSFGKSVLMVKLTSLVVNGRAEAVSSEVGTVSGSWKNLKSSFGGGKSNTASGTQSPSTMGSTVYLPAGTEVRFVMGAGGGNQTQAGNNQTQTAQNNPTNQNNSGGGFSSVTQRLTGGNSGNGQAQGGNNGGGRGGQMQGNNNANGQQGNPNGNNGNGQMQGNNNSNNGNGQMQGGGMGNQGNGTNGNGNGETATTVELNGMRYELQSCQRESQQIVCHLTVTNISGNDDNLASNVSGHMIFYIDQLGNNINASTAQIGNGNLASNPLVIPNLQEPVQIVFQNASAQATTLARLSIPMKNKGGWTEVRFSNVPITNGNNQGGSGEGRQRM